MQWFVSESISSFDETQLFHVHACRIRICFQVKLIILSQWFGVHTYLSSVKINIGKEARNLL